MAKQPNIAEQVFLDAFEAQRLAINEAGQSNLPGQENGPYDAYRHLLPFSCPPGDFFHRVTVGEHRSDRHHQNLLEVMQLPVARSPRVLNFLQAVQRCHPLLRSHGVHQKDESRRDFQGVHKMYA